MNFLPPFFINFYRGMGLLIEEKNQKFSLEREIVGSEDEEVLGNNKVFSDDDDVEPALPLAEVDMSKDDI